MSEPRYSEELNSSEDGREQEHGLLNSTRKKSPPIQKCRTFLHILLGISISFNLLLLGIIWVNYDGIAKPASYENGFASDLGAAKGAIGLIQMPFSGGVQLSGDGKLFTNQADNKYVGKPSKEIDEAWEELQIGLNIDLSRDEIDLPESTFQWPESGKFLSGLEVYHSLHCLNRLRQAFYPDHYRYIFARPDDPSFEDHIGHCINHIRQAIQCHADLTPMEWRLEGSKIILNTNTLHTCRDWARIHAWAGSHQTRFEDIESWKNGSLVLID